MYCNGSLLSKFGQFTILPQGDIHLVIVENILADDAYHCLGFLGLSNCCKPVLELFYCFFKYHDIAKLHFFYDSLRVNGKKTSHLQRYTSLRKTLIAFSTIGVDIDGEVMRPMATDGLPVPYGGCR